jgi:hypothetical protein
VLEWQCQTEHMIFKAVLSSRTTPETKEAIILNLY